MRRVLVIGIGVGDPEHLTIQAIRALNQVDVFFVVDKGPDKSSLVRLRHEILERYAEQDYRVVEAQDPDRDRTAAAYPSAVGEWRARRADTYERLIADELTDRQCGAFLVWGDPTLYDSTIAVLDDRPRPRKRRVRLRGHPGDQQHLRARRPAPRRAQPGRSAGPDHHRPPAGRRFPGRCGRPGRDARRTRGLHPDR